MSADIPTPAELIEAARKNHDAEADALIARIVAKLRANPHGYVTEFASMPALRVAEARMSERGWVCKTWGGSIREPEPSITVEAPKEGAR